MDFWEALHQISDRNTVNKAIEELEGKLSLLYKIRDVVHPCGAPAKQVVLPSQPVVSPQSPRSRKHGRRVPGCRRRICRKKKKNAEEAQMVAVATSEKNGDLDVKTRRAFTLVEYGPLAIAELSRLSGCAYQSVYNTTCMKYKEFFEREGGKITLTNEGRLRLLAPKED